jgi:hypothetical protein
MSSSAPIHFEFASCGELPFVCVGGRGLAEVVEAEAVESVGTRVDRGVIVYGCCGTYWEDGFSVWNFVEIWDGEIGNRVF